MCDDAGEQAGGGAGQRKDGEISKNGRGAQQEDRRCQLSRIVEHRADEAAQPQPGERKQPLQAEHPRQTEQAAGEAVQERGRLSRKDSCQKNARQQDHQRFAGAEAEDRIDGDHIGQPDPDAGQWQGRRHLHFDHEQHKRKSREQRHGIQPPDRHTNLLPSSVSLPTGSQGGAADRRWAGRLLPVFPLSHRSGPDSPPKACGSLPGR